MLLFFFFNDTATTEIYTLSLHDALPILLKKIDRSSPGVLGRFGMIAVGVRVVIEGVLGPRIGLDVELFAVLAQGLLQGLDSRHDVGIVLTVVAQHRARNILDEIQGIGITAIV